MSVSIVNGVATFTGTDTLYDATNQLGGATSAVIVGYSSIGQNSFQNASGLTSVTIPSSVTSIGTSAFSNSGLTSLLIPASVTQISQAIVWSTNNLTTITFAPNSLLTIIDYRTFKNATGLTSITIPNGVTLIDDEAFSSTGRLTSITIPSSVTSIGSTAFTSSGLISATISNSASYSTLGLINTTSPQTFFGKTNVIVVTSDTKLFYGTGALTNTIVATNPLGGAKSAIIQGYTSIGDSAFIGTGITSIDIQSSVTSIGNDVFQWTALKSITFPSSVTSIGDRCFTNSGSLTSITINSSVFSIGGGGAFANTGLTTATFQTRSSVIALGLTSTASTQSFFGKNGVTVIALDTKIFTGPGSLTNATSQLSGKAIVVIEGYSSIGANAFQDASGVTSVIISSVTSIGANAFQDASRVTSVIIPSSVTSIGENAFQGSGLTNATFPTRASVVALGLTITNSTQTFFGKSNVLVTASDTKIFDGSGSLTNATAQLSGATHAIIQGYTSIGDSAFAGAGITSINIQSSVTSIGGEVFVWTGLKSVTFPSSVTSIGDRCFTNSGSLTSITINSTTISIGFAAFQNTGLTTATFQTRSSVIALGLTITASPQTFFFKNGVTVIALDTKIFTGPGTDGSLTNATSQLSGKAIVVIEGYSSIGANAFQDASGVTSVIISSSVTSIVSNAFTNSGLTNATFPTRASLVAFGFTITNSTQTFFGKSNVLVTASDTKIFDGSGSLTNATAQLSGATHAIIQGYTSIGDSAFFGAGITSIDIQSAVTSIGISAFWGSGLKSIIIPSSVTRLNDNLFNYSGGLTSVTIPASVTGIGSGIFANTALTTAIFVKSSNLFVFNVSVGTGQNISGRSNVTVSIITKVFNGSGALTNASNNLQGATNVEITGYSSIGANAFQNANGLTSITIPSTVNSIDASAFQGSGLTSATLANSTYFSTYGLTFTDSPQSFFGKSDVVVTSLDTKIFNGSGELTGATAQLGVATNVIIIGYSSIGASAFQGATGLTSVAIPSSVTSIRTSAFQGATGLTSVTIPSSVTSIGSTAFTSSGLTSATFPTRTSIIELGLTSTASTQSFFGKTGVIVIALDTKIFSGTGPLTNATSQLDGKAIVRIEGYSSIGANAFQDASGVTSITIQSTVTSIGDSAFQGAIGLTLITLPSSVDSIGESAFQGASGLTYISIPSAVTMIGDSAFQSASNIATFFVNDSNNNYSSDSYGALFNKDKTIIIQYPIGNTSISYTIPNTVESIGASAFQGAIGLTSVTIPSSVSSIGASAFQGATGLTSITIPSSVSSIGSNAFLSSGITSAIFEESTLLDGLSPSIIPGSGKTLYGKSGINISWLTKVFNGSGSLTGATALLYGATSVRIATYSSIGEAAFQDANGLTSLTIPSSVTSIGESAFQGVTGLSSITIPSSVISIESNAFGYSSLTSITIPSSVTSIGLSAFQDMPYLPEITVDPANTYYSSDNGVLFNTDKTILLQYPNGNPRTLYNIPDSVTIIGASAFLRATSLTSVTIPSSVSSIGTSAFQGASGITSITIPSSVSSIGNNAFQSSGITTAVFEESILLDGLGITPGTNTLYGASEVNVSWITKVFNGSGVLSDATALLYGATNVRIATYSSIGAYAFSGVSSITSITIPSSVTSIGSGAFSGCATLTTFTFSAESQLTLIDSSLFMGATALTSIAIPNSVTSIGEWAFTNATALTSLSIPSSVTSISDNAFYGTTSLLQITVDVSNNTYKSDTFGRLFNKTQTTIIQYPAGNTSSSYEIPSSVTTIGTYAFQGASALTYIILPVSATSIGATAFQDSGLTTALVVSALYVDDIGLSAGDLVSGYTVPLFFGKSSVTVRYNDAKLAFIEAVPAAVISNNTFISLLTSLAVNISNITSEIVPLTNDPYVEYSATLTIPNGNLSTLSDVNKANIIDNVKALYAAQLGVSINKVIVTLSSGSIIINVDILKDGIIETVVPICFPKGTPVTTNQGDIAIEKLNPDIHTIRGKKIVAITQTRPLHKYIISIEKDALGKNVPSAPIQISKEHKVFYKGEMVKANELVEVCEGVTRIPYSGETLYNVLMEKHDKMMINNVICETLDPKNIMAKIFGGKYNLAEQDKICKELNDIIKADNIPAYKKLYASLK